MKTDKFENKLIQTTDKYKMFKKGDRVLVALSGGKDSVALLYALNSLSSYFGISLFAFHLNHGIRGDEADSDERLAKEHCEKLSVPFVSLFADVPSVSASTGIGIEAVAREIRYKEMYSAYNTFRCTKIATAHTASDNSETLLMSLIRNSNAKGIPAVRDVIVRPLIEHTTDEVLDYCIGHNLMYATDSTNFDDNYTRNYVRHKVLPAVYEICPSFDETASRFSAIRRSEIALTEKAVQQYFDRNPDPMLLSSLRTLSTDIAFFNVLYTVITSYFDIELSYRQFDDIIQLLNHGQSGCKIKLKDGKFISLGYERLELCDELVLPDYEIELCLGKNRIPDSNIVLYVETHEEYKARISNKLLKNIKINKLTKNSLIRYNIITSLLTARTRKTGDSVFCRGMTKNVKKFMIDEKIPAVLRSRIPVVCLNGNILWVPGLGLNESVEFGDGETVSLSIDFENTDS